MQFPTLDGKTVWTASLDQAALIEVEENLGKLRRSLNKLHGQGHYETKVFVVGLTFGIEAYLETLKKGK